MKSALRMAARWFGAIIVDALGCGNNRWCQDVAMKPEVYHLRDDGQVPNNAKLPLVLYRGAFDAGAIAQDVIAHFTDNGWSGAWVNGIFDYHHYHARSHEVLANLGANVSVQFGGAAGPVVDFAGGDAVVIPAGGGHCRLSTGAGLVIVGAYPAGQEDWDLKRADRPADYERALIEVPGVRLPACDPVKGPMGPLLVDYWMG